MTKPLPIHPSIITAAAERFPTPFYLYDAAGIMAQTRALYAAFDWATGFTNYFAVKATPNPVILRLLAEAGCGMDCSSLAELVLAERIGLRGERIMFSSNNTPPEEFQHASRLGALINLDHPDLLEPLIQAAGVPTSLCLRYNPGSLREGNAIIGRPEESKFGATREQVIAGYLRAHAAGVQSFGLHTMLASNERNPEYFIATARMLFELAVELANHGIRLAYINLGGGIGIPYQPDQQPVDLGRISAGVQQAYTELIEANQLAPIRLALECGRVLTGPYGLLITRVRHIKQTYRSYAGLDATMADLMRPGMYAAYHHVSVINKLGQPATHSYDLTGSLCENNDKFAIGRHLPALEPGDLLAIHDAGAHGRAMGFNYNGKLRCAEYLVEPDGSIRLIRRAETLADYFATLAFE